MGYFSFLSELSPLTPLIRIHLITQKGSNHSVLRPFHSRQIYSSKIRHPGKYKLSIMPECINNRLHGFNLTLLISVCAAELDDLALCFISLQLHAQCEQANDQSFSAVV